MAIERYTYEDVPEELRAHLPPYVQTQLGLNQNGEVIDASASMRARDDIFVRTIETAAQSAGLSTSPPAASTSGSTTETTEGERSEEEVLRGLQALYVTDFMQAAEDGLTNQEILALATANPDILTIPEGGITDAFREAVIADSTALAQSLGMIPPEITDPLEGAGQPNTEREAAREQMAQLFGFLNRGTGEDGEPSRMQQFVMNRATGFFATGAEFTANGGSISEREGEFDFMTLAALLQREEGGEMSIPSSFVDSIEDIMIVAVVNSPELRTQFAQMQGLNPEEVAAIVAMENEELEAMLVELANDGQLRPFAQQIAFGAVDFVLNLVNNFLPDGLIENLIQQGENALEDGLNYVDNLVPTS